VADKRQYHNTDRNPRKRYSEDPDDFETQNDFDVEDGLDRQSSLAIQPTDEELTLTPDEIRQLKLYVAREKRAEARSAQLEHQDLFRWLWGKVHQMLRDRANALSREYLYEIINGIMEDLFGRWA
jgi:hypothetical protein